MSLEEFIRQYGLTQVVAVRDGELVQLHPDDPEARAVYEELLDLLESGQLVASGISDHDVR